MFKTRDMRIIWLLLFTQFFLTNTEAQITCEDIVTENERYRANLNKAFANPEETPLTDHDLATFQALPFYPIDTTYYIVADFERVEAEPFEMKTTTSRRPVYKIYARATFVLFADTITLYIYQNLKLTEQEEYRDYLFLPFTDLTNGEGTYAGGRYIDLRIPNGNTIIIDFNKAYNPYCAYNYNYSCPIPPEENHMNNAVVAGVKYP